MNLLAALLIAENVRQRAEQGDCPTTPAQPVETLENVVMELQRAIARDAVAGAIVEVKKERDDARATLREADELIEEWIGILQANDLRSSAIDGEALRTKIAALLPNSPQ